MHLLSHLDFEQSSALYLRIDRPSDRGAAAAEQCAIIRSLLSQPDLRGMLAAPMARDITSIVLVGSEEMLGRPDAPPDADMPPAIGRAAKSANLKRTTIARPDHFVIEQCMRFTLAFWLERAGWCRGGESLLQSSFLGGSGKRNDRLISVEAAIHCGTSGDIYLQTKPTIVRLYIVEPWFIDDPSSVANDYRWVSCLPRLGKGRLVGMHRSLPPHAPFRQWIQMRQYWMNAYGYHLPAAEPEAYYDVQFRGMQNTFLYPYYCVLTGEPEPANFRDSKAVIAEAREKFIRSINAVQPNICGKDVKLTAEEASPFDAQLAYASVLSLPVVKKPRGGSALNRAINAAKRYSTVVEVVPLKRERTEDGEERARGGADGEEDGTEISDQTKRILVPLSDVAPSPLKTFKPVFGVPKAAAAKAPPIPSIAAGPSKVEVKMPSGDASTVPAWKGEVPTAKAVPKEATVPRKATVPPKATVPAKAAVSSKAPAPQKTPAPRKATPASNVGTIAVDGMTPVGRKKPATVPASSARRKKGGIVVD